MSAKITGYIGTYTDTNSKGIYSFEYDESTKELYELILQAEIDNPTYLAINKERSALFSVAKEYCENNIALGGVASFNINSDYSLSLTNKILTTDKPPCHLSLINNGTFLIASYYHDKHALAYSIDNGTILKDTTSKAIHNGNSHIHYAALTPDQKYVCILDLGRDEVCLYEFNDGQLKIKSELILKVKSNSGPRHMVFSTCGNFAYILCELSSEIITLRYLGISGFEIINYTSTLPKDFICTNSTAAIRITQDGKYLYVSNRGHDSIAAYKTTANGTIELINIYPTYGKEPRDFNITPSDKSLIIGNHKSNNITIYERKENGELVLAKKDIFAPSPVCIAFL